MLLSLRATWVHQRQLAYQGLDTLRTSSDLSSATTIRLERNKMLLRYLVFAPHCRLITPISR